MEERCDEDGKALSLLRLGARKGRGWGAGPGLQKPTKNENDMSEGQDLLQGTFDIHEEEAVEAEAAAEVSDEGVL